MANGRGVELGYAGHVLLLCAALSGACAPVRNASTRNEASAAGGATAVEAEAPPPTKHAAPAQTPTPGPTSSPSPANPFYDDVTIMRFLDRAPGDVLVRTAAADYITVEQFNAWLGTYPLHVTAHDLEGAQREALSQMVRFKLLADSARLAGYVEKLGQGTDERTLARAYMRDQISNVGMISDEAVARYAREHPEQFAQIGPDVPETVRMMAIRGAIRSEQLRARLRDLEKSKGIRYMLRPAP